MQRTPEFENILNTIRAGAEAGSRDGRPTADFKEIAAELTNNGEKSLPRSAPRQHNLNMQDYPTHREMDAKLATIEAKIDGRLARIEDSIRDIKDSMGGTRRSVWGAAGATIITVVGSALAVAFGIASFNAALLGNMTSAGQAGQSIGAALEASRQQQAETAKLLSEIRAEREASIRAARPADPPASAPQ